MRARSTSALALTLAAFALPALAQDGTPNASRTPKAEAWPAPQDLSRNFTEDGVDHGWTFEWHGYVRMPVRVVDSPKGDREPYLVDDNYTESGFAYLPVNETEWAEMNLEAHFGESRFVAGLFAAQYSDWSEQPSKGHSTPAYAFVEHTWRPDPVVVQMRAGMFWERMGYVDAYDTYVIGRTRQSGLQVDIKAFDLAYLRMGFGAHARTQVRGHAPIGWAVLGADLGWLDVGLHAVHTWTNDDDDQFNESFRRGSMTVYGADVMAAVPFVGPLHLAIGFYDADKIEFLSESLEVLHSIGGNNLRQNFLGNQNEGTGEIQNTALELTWNVHRTVAAFASEQTARKFEGLDLKLFGMRAHVATPHERTDIADEFKNDRVYFKWGAELFYQALPTVLHQFYASVRFDRVILDTDHEALSFRVWTPRLGVRPNKGMDVWLSYSSYAYGDLLQPRREVLNRVGEDTRPDEHVFKLQAEMAW